MHVAPLVVLLVLLMACNKGTPAPTPGPATATVATGGAASTADAMPTGTAPTIAVAPAETGLMAIGGTLGAGNYAYDKDLAVPLKISGPAGIAVKIQGATAKLEAGAPVRFNVDFLDAFLRTPLADPAIVVAVTATGPDGAAAHETLVFPGSERNKVYDRLAGVAGGPVPFPGDAGAKLREDTLVLMTGSAFEKVFGPEKARGFDIDFVAVRKVIDRVVRVCGTYSNGSETTQVKLKAVDAADAVYDRRTGKLLGEKTFAGSEGSCPENVAGKEGATTGNVGGTWSEADEEAWLRMFLKSGAAGEAEIDPPASAHAGVVEGMAAPVASADAGTGFPTLATLAARATKAGMTDLGEVDMRADDYPREVRIGGRVAREERGALARDVLDGSPVELRLIDFAGADKLATPTAFDVGPRRAVWVAAPGPEDAAWIARLAPKLATFKAEQSSQIAKLLAGTGLKENKDGYGSNRDDDDGLREWVIDAATPDGMPRAHVRVVYYGHLLDGKRTDGEPAADLVAVDGSRVLFVHSFRRELSQKVMDALVK